MTSSDQKIYSQTIPCAPSVTDIFILPDKEATGFRDTVNIPCCNKNLYFVKVVRLLNRMQSMLSSTNEIQQGIFPAKIWNNLDLLINIYI